MQTSTQENENKSMHLKDSDLAAMLNDCSIDAIIAFDSSYTIITWNCAAEILYKTKKAKALGVSLLRLIPGIKEDSDILNAIQHAFTGFKSFVPASKKHAHRVHSENHFIPLTDNDGNIFGVMNIVHDVAHRIKAERQLQYLNDELEKRFRQLKTTSEELASFTFITSNKIKEPIRQIYTGIEHLIKVEAGRLSDSGKATFRRMQSSINRMDLLLDDILSLAQISILQKPVANIELTKLLKEIDQEFKTKAEKNININFEELCTIAGHRDYLHLLFHNLFDNAIKFNENETVIINIRCEKITLNEEDASAVEEYFKVSVTDNGIGFNESDKEKIFEMFETLHPRGKYKGSGMGLTIARKIMYAHDGFITVESKPGSGASFHCFFPVLEN
ncbi:MAG: PAS domain-containing protein [Parafilimonas sp.]|nr:PAS domain-containing protein [Parafilimonas sp.]